MPSIAVKRNAGGAAAGVRGPDAHCPGHQRQGAGAVGVSTISGIMVHEPGCFVCLLK